MSSVVPKPNAPAFTVPQLPEAMDAMNERAQQLGVRLRFPVLTGGYYKPCLFVLNPLPLLLK